MYIMLVIIEDDLNSCTGRSCSNRDNDKEIRNDEPQVLSLCVILRLKPISVKPNSKLRNFSSTVYVASPVGLRDASFC